MFQYRRIFIPHNAFVVNFFLPYISDLLRPKSKYQTATKFYDACDFFALSLYPVLYESHSTIEFCLYYFQMRRATTQDNIDKQTGDVVYKVHEYK